MGVVARWRTLLIPFFECSGRFFLRGGRALPKGGSTPAARRQDAGRRARAKRAWVRRTRRATRRGGKMGTHITAQRSGAVAARTLLPTVCRRRDLRTRARPRGHSFRIQKQRRRERKGKEICFGRLFAGNNSGKGREAEAKGWPARVACACWRCS